MSAKQVYLFSMDLRFYNQIIRLTIYEEDILSDVINRLSSSIAVKHNPHQQHLHSKQRLRTKLEEQFKKIVQKNDVSETVKAKLDSLLDQSKIIIVAIDTHKKDSFLAQTPFKNLQDSTLAGRKVGSQKLKKSMHTFQGEKPNISRNYQSQQLASLLVPIPYDDSQFANVIVRTRNNLSLTPNKLDYLEAKQSKVDYFETKQPKVESSTQIFQKKYEAIDRKCQNFISKNMPHAQIAENNQTVLNYQPYKPYEERSLQKLASRKMLLETDLRVKETTQKQRPLRAISDNDYEKLREPIKANQTFHNYKINRYKTSTLPINQLPTQKGYQAKYNRQNLPTSKSYSKLITCNSELNSGQTIKNYDNTTPTIRCYDKLLDTKPLSTSVTTVSSKRFKGRFNYLGA